MQLYDIEFLFTNEKKADGLEVKYEILKRYRFFSISVALGLIPRLIKKKYDLIIFPPMDSRGEIIDNLFCFIIAKLRKRPYALWSERWNWKKRSTFSQGKYSNYSGLFELSVEAILAKQIDKN